MNLFIADFDELSCKGIE